METSVGVGRLGILILVVFLEAKKVSGHFERVERCANNLIKHFLIPLQFWYLSGIIEDVGEADEIAAKYASRHDDFAEVIDCSGMSVLPGLVDGHTHPVFAGDRVHEFAMKVMALVEKVSHCGTPGTLDS